MKKSYRDLIKQDLVEKLLADVKKHKIINEADLQCRAACHLDKMLHSGHRLTNQPNIPVGIRRAKDYVKPDIVIYDKDDGPLTAVELKCFLDRSCNFNQIADQVWKDAEKLRKFRTRYGGSKNAHALVFVNAEREDYFALKSEFRAKEEWMSHYFFFTVVNVFCHDDGRQRHGYNKWADEMEQWKRLFEGAPTQRETVEDSGIVSTVLDALPAPFRNLI
jgi:hypothetical protein